MDLWLSICCFQQALERETHRGTTIASCFSLSREKIHIYIHSHRLTEIDIHKEIDGQLQRRMGRDRPTCT